MLARESNLRESKFWKFPTYYIQYFLGKVHNLSEEKFFLKSSRISTHHVEISSGKAHCIIFKFYSQSDESSSIEFGVLLAPLISSRTKKYK